MSEAAEFMARGLSVLILHDVAAGVCSCGDDSDKHRATSAGKHPRMGGAWQHAGLSTLNDAGAWLTAYPAANLGILTGTASGVWVLDVDPKHEGDKRLSELEAAHGHLPYTYTVRTGSGGHHYYFRMPYDFTPTNSRGSLPVGIDVRGEGGQVVAAGGRTLIGDYAVSVDAPPAEAPEWLLEMIRPRPVAESAPGPVGEAWVASEADGPRLRAYAVQAVQAELDRIRSAPDGARGSTAFRAACSLIELCNSPWTGLAGGVVLAAYEQACETAMLQGGAFDLAEARQSWASAARTVGSAGRPVPPEHIGTVIDAAPFSVASVAPVPEPAEAYGPSMIANPFMLPIQRSAAHEHEVSAPVATPWVTGPATLEPTDPEVARMVRSMEVRAAAAAIVRQRAEDAAGAGARRAALRAQVVSAAQLALMPGPEPLVEGLLNLDSTAWMIGKSGSYKSFVALDLAAHVARGMSWQGRKVHGGRVLYAAMEGARGMSLRVAAWEERFGPIGDNLAFLPVPVSAKDDQAWGDLVAVAAEMGPVMVIVDTQARASIGIKENDNSEMMLFVDAVDRLRAATGACVLTVHHIGRAGTDARGASSIDGAQDSELRIERTGPRNIRIHQDKQKDASDEEVLDLALEAYGRSLVVVPVADGAVRVVLSLEQRLAERRESGRQSMLDHAVRVVADVYTGVGGTKSEIRRSVYERMGKRALADNERSSSFDKVWSRLLTDRVVGKVHGTAAWRFIPVDDRAGLIEPSPEGGFFAPMIEHA